MLLRRQRAAHDWMSTLATVRDHSSCGMGRRGVQRQHCTTAGAPWTGMMDVYDAPLPAPMIPGANAGDTECLLDEDFRDIATSHNVRTCRKL